MFIIIIINTYPSGCTVNSSLLVQFLLCSRAAVRSYQIKIKILILGNIFFSYNLYVMWEVVRLISKNFVQI